MILYAVALTLGPLVDTDQPATFWIEFYSADDAAEATKQAQSTHGPGTVVAIAPVLESTRNLPAAEVKQ
jgi:hypothetical protein